jgi:N-acetylglucosaminyldiphosphoundecaprenol N-acetyl-beta-D-mannosaminyltransferase
MAERIEILGSPIDLDDSESLEGRLASWLNDPPGGLRHVATVNPEYLIAARRSRRFAHVLRSADLALADGVGISIAARLLRLPAPPRITGNDLVELVAAMEHANKRIFLLGAAEGVAAAAAGVLRERHPQACITGVFSGDPSPAGWPEIAAALSEARPTVLFVAFGHPRQDFWIATYREQLAGHGILVASGIGGVYDYLSGRVPRAPERMRRLGLEWLYRLIRQPWRVRRQAVLPVFGMLVMVEAAASMFGRARAG